MGVADEKFASEYGEALLEGPVVIMRDQFDGGDGRDARRRSARR